MHASLPASFSRFLSNAQKVRCRRMPEAHPPSPHCRSESTLITLRSSLVSRLLVREGLVGRAANRPGTRRPRTSVRFLGIRAPSFHCDLRRSVPRAGEGARCGFGLWAALRSLLYPTNPPNPFVYSSGPFLATIQTIPKSINILLLFPFFPFKGWPYSL